MKGYKVLNKGLINRYGYQYEIGKKYILIGELKWSENGFHFCSNPEDCLRYINGFTDEYDMTEVEGSGEIYKFDDDYYGYYDMYASSEMEITRVIPREEFIGMVVNSHNDGRVQRLISTTSLTEDEMNLIEAFYPNLKPYIDYYQHKDLDAFTRKLK